VQISFDKKIIYTLLCLGCFTISFNVAAITAAIPIISLDLGLADFLVAKIIPYYLIPYGVGALLYAPLTRFFSYRSVLGVSMALYAFSSYFCATSSELNSILIGRVCMGVAGASAIPIGLMVIGEFFEKEIRGRLVGAFFGFSFVASFIGIVTGGFAHWRMLFFAPAAIGTILAILLFVYPTEILKKKHVGNINYLTALSNKAILKVFLFIFVISFLYHGVHKWYGVYLSRVYGLNQLAISWFFIVTLVGGFIGQLTGGVISDLKGRRMACYVGILGLGLSILFLAGTYPLFVLGVVLLVVSMCWTIGHNGISTVLTDFPDEDRPTIASLNSSVRFISGGLGFQISALFVSSSFGLTFLVIGILILLLAFTIRYILPSST